MKIELKKIILENYKCFPHKEVDFFHRTQISGRNRSGKSTLNNAFLEVLTGKELDGSQPDGVRPHDENGVEVPKIDVIREIHLDIDGKPTVIRKKTYQKWRKPRGTTEEVFDGNGEDFEVDGFPYKPAKFKEFMADIADPDVLLMCSNANPFLTTLKKSTADARKILEKLAGFSVEKFIAENPQYADVSELTKGHPIEDTFKKLRKDLLAQKKKIDAQNEKIKYEQARPLESCGIEISDLELAKGEWKEKLEEADKQEQMLEESVKAYDELSAEIQTLKSRKTEIEMEADDVQLEKRLAVREKISSTETKKHDLEFSISNRKNGADIEEKRIASLSNDIVRYREKYEEVSKQEYDESTLREIEAEQFDESSYTCPTCGQELPPEKKQQLLSDFEETKQQRIKAEKDRRNAFFIKQDAELSNITELGNKCSTDLKSAKERKELFEKEIAELNQSLELVNADIESLQAELKAIPTEADMTGNSEYETLCFKIRDKEARLVNLPNGSEKRLELRQKRNQYMTEIAKIDSQIQAAQREQDRKDDILIRLQSELRNMAQTQADIEKQIDALSEFSRAKNNALAEKINPYFRHFKFEFLEYTIEQNPVETCKMICSGTSYMDGLNGGDKRLVDVDICRGLQDMNGICVPIFLDESNTVDPERIPVDMEQQLITIQRTDGDLKVEEMK